MREYEQTSKYGRRPKPDSEAAKQGRAIEYPPQIPAEQDMNDMHRRARELYIMHIRDMYDQM
jgi:hypothetical protein